MSVVAFPPYFLAEDWIEYTIYCRNLLYVHIYIPTGLLKTVTGLLKNTSFFLFKPVLVFLGRHIAFLLGDMEN